MSGYSDSYTKLFAKNNCCGSKSKGIQGDQGENGNTGPIGPVGYQGATGPVGPTGPQGLCCVGPTGLTGPTGPSGGLQGATGPAGVGTIVNFNTGPVSATVPFNISSSILYTTPNITLTAGKNWAISWSIQEDDYIADSNFYLVFIDSVTSIAYNPVVINSGNNFYLNSSFNSFITCGTVNDFISLTGASTSTSFTIQLRQGGGSPTAVNLFFSISLTQLTP
jgi:hypothetical protein